MLWSLATEGMLFSLLELEITMGQSSWRVLFRSRIEVGMGDLTHLEGVFSSEELESLSFERELLSLPAGDLLGESI
jgi:hypothetical protein